MRLTRYFLLPFRATPLMLVATFTIGLLLAAKAGFVGIPLGCLLISWFFKYCFVVLDSVVAAEDEPPVLSIEMVNPISEQRPLVVALLIVAEVMLVTELRAHAGSLAGLAAVIFFSWALPANIAVLGLTGNPFHAVWPPALVALIRSLGRDYLLLNGVLLVSACLMYGMAANGISLWMLLAATQLLFLLSFALTGGVMLEHRHELGIESKSRQERLAERATREHESERRHMLDTAYMRFRVSKPLEGWQQIEAWLKLHAHADRQDVEYRALLQATSRWDDMRAADRLANDFVAILLAKRATGEALAVVEQRLASNPQYQLSPPEQAVRIAELAGAAGKRALQRKLAPRPVGAS
ncbi:MAG TPA: hypothetical protein VFO44_09250 [Steroidobacteraceae bacterium]|nr:hypothetical protein [Steroidobacteraceae bacterium]